MGSDLNESGVMVLSVGLIFNSHPIDLDGYGTEHAKDASPGS